MNEFDLHWRDGTVQRVEGRDAADAINRAGYGRGALRALDYYSPVGEHTEEEMFDEIIKPLMEWLARNGYPRTNIIIEATCAEIVEGVEVVATDEFIGD